MTVEGLARAVAERLGLDDGAIAEVGMAAGLHDIGKIAVPDAILCKPGPLNDEEWEVMRTHPIVGEQLLAGPSRVGRVASVVRAEHERWDGTGYPDGIAGEAIPLTSRIVSVCDAYHTMTNHQPYRKGLSPATARDRLSAGAGTQFCPHCVRALLDVLATQ